MLELAARVDEEWVAEVSGLVHDALVVRESADAAASGRYELELRRVGYEHPRRKRRWLGLIKVWRFPRVPTRLVVEPVGAVRTTGGEEPLPDLDQVLSLDLDAAGGTLTVRRDFLQTVLELGSEARLSLSDLGEPSEEESVIDIGGRLVPAGWIEDLQARRGAS